MVGFSRRLEAGFTFVELLVVTALVAILASAIMPLARAPRSVSARSRCVRSLREIRTAIDHYKDARRRRADSADLDSHWKRRLSADLETLVVGVDSAGDATARTS
jgi:general secretion pathway protein G